MNDRTVGVLRDDFPEFVSAIHLAVYDYSRSGGLRVDQVVFSTV